MITINGNIPIEIACNIISRYIYDKKGVWVDVQLPILPQHEEKFITALNISLSHFKIEI